MSFSHPKFAVVGHPNKGKSSIVSVLAMDRSVQISNTPGTTTKQRSFPLKVDNEIVYELIDTPGFQRGRRVLAWLEEHTVSADKKHQIVQKFINTHKDNPKYNDEIELLEPLMNGAGIIYVVDGSKPYGKEYEADMEILRWTGQPSMALINHIDDTDYSTEWKRALGQYFKLVRTFNPMKISLTQHLKLLESMAQLNEDWTDGVKYSIDIFKEYHHKKVEKSSQVISELMYEMIHLNVQLPLNEEKPSKEKKEKLLEHYRNRLRKLEKNAHTQLETIWHHEGIVKEKKEGVFDTLDLFSKTSASLFGLTKEELMVRGAMAGAGVDILSLGSTLFLGTLMGGLGGYFGFEKLSEVKVLGQKIGKKSIEIGPMSNVNFPFVILARAIYFASELATFSHAQEEHKIGLMQENFTDRWLRADLKNDLTKHHQSFLYQSFLSNNEEREEYQFLVQDILLRLI